MTTKAFSVLSFLKIQIPVIWKVVKLELKAVTVIPIVRALLMLEPRNRSSVTNRFHQLWIHQQTTAYDPSTVDW